MDLSYKVDLMKLLKRPRWQVWLLEALLAVAIFLAIDQWRARTLLADEQFAPRSHLPLLDSTSVASLPSKGRSLVYFFAPWCAVCKLSIDNLNDIAASQPDVSVQLVALDYGSIEEVRQFIGNQSLNFPVLLGNRQTLQAWKIQAYPTYYIIDENGRITARNMGYSSELGMKVRLAF